jgi:hypothetical protein
MAVVNDFVKVALSVTGVGEVRLITVPGPGEPGTSPTLFRRTVVTVSGAPDVMVVAVVMELPGADVKVPFGTKLKATWIGIAQAGEALTAATAIAVLRRAVRREDILMIISLKSIPFDRKQRLCHPSKLLILHRTRSDVANKIT